MGRPKVEPDPEVRAAILAAALAIVHEDGLGALSVLRVLTRAQLGTRAFYRHFECKEDLVTAIFVEIARVEMHRLQEGMAGEDPVRSVVAWIERRLDLTFEHQVESNSRQLSFEARSQVRASPERLAPAYAQILRPLIEQIDRGTHLGLFGAAHPAEEAMSIQGVVWANIESQWATGTCDLSDMRKRVLRFCLRGLGVAGHVIDEVISDTKERG